MITPTELVNGENTPLYQRFSEHRNDSIRLGATYIHPLHPMESYARTTEDYFPLTGTDAATKARELLPQLRNIQSYFVNLMDTHREPAEVQGIFDAYKASLKAKENTTEIDQEVNFALGRGLDYISRVIQSTTRPIDGKTALEDHMSPVIQESFQPLLDDEEFKPILDLVEIIGKSLQQADSTEQPPTLKEKVAIVGALAGFVQKEYEVHHTKHESVPKQLPYLRNYIFSLFHDAYGQSEPINYILGQKAAIGPKPRI